MKKQVIKGYQDKELICYIWDNVDNPKAVIQIVHGMQEHALRYTEFAEQLNRYGYIVFASDLRGHGATCGNVVDLGYSDGDIFQEIVSDQIIITDRLVKEYGLPIYLFGHSFGSFISQRYIQESRNVDKVILSGSAYTNTLTMRAGKIVAKLTSVFKGQRARARLIEKMSFGAYVKKFPQGNWLTTDNKVFAEYRADEYCGRSFPAAFYTSMFNNVVKNYKNISKIESGMKILIVSGAQDPIGGNGKLVRKLQKVYAKYGINAQLKLYDGERHELINGLKKEDVFKDIVEFYDK